MLKRSAVALTAIIALFATSLVATAAPGEKPDKPEKPEKVELCHIPGGDPGNQHTISVGAPAEAAHLAHGDVAGACDVERPGGDDDSDSEDDDDDSDDTNVDPIANAGNDQCVPFGTLVRVDGGLSSDPDGLATDLDFDWDFVLTPIVSDVDDGDLSDDDDIDPTFTPDKVGTYRLQLNVSDDDGGTDSDIVEIQVHMDLTLDDDEYSVEEGDTEAIVVTLNENAPQDITVFVDIDEDAAVVVLASDDEVGDAVDSFVVDEGDDEVTVYLLGVDADDDDGDLTVDFTTGTGDCTDVESADVEVTEEVLTFIPSTMFFLMRSFRMVF